MLSGLKPKEHVTELGVYEPGRPLDEVARALGFAHAGELVKLASNENALGPSPLAMEAMRSCVSEMHRYPDGGAYYLREALSAKFDLPADHFILGCGSNELIEFLGHVFLEEGTNLVMADGAFLIYRLVAAAFAAETRAVPMRDYIHDLDAMCAAVDDNTRLFFVANPNNPTGTCVDAAELEALDARLPAQVLLVVDEAYVELLPEAERPRVLERVRAGGRLIVLRTFSKVYGLAGLRIGYGMAPPELIRLLEKFRQPFNVSAMAQQAAQAALADETYVEQSRQLVLAGKAQLEAGCRALGLETVPSQANFLLIRTGRGRQLFENLQKDGVVVRPMDAYGLPDFVRVTIGTDLENQRFLSALEPQVSRR